MLGAAERQKDVGKPRAYKEASLPQKTVSSVGNVFGLSLHRYRKGVHGAGSLASFLWNLVVGILQQLPLGCQGQGHKTTLGLAAFRSCAPYST